MKILKVYKQLTDVVVLQDDDGSIRIRAGIQDDGSAEEQEVIRQTVGSPGFRSTSVDSVKPNE